MMRKMLERIEQLLRGDLPPAPIARLIGFRLSAIKPGESEASRRGASRPALPNFSGCRRKDTAKRKGGA